MKRKAVIFDRDGTLASCQRHLVQDGRSDWDEFNAWIPLDAEIPETAALFRLLRQHTDLTLFVVTGRMDDQRVSMLSWLQKYDLYPDQLLMRHHRDRRADIIVKREIFEKFIEPEFDVQLVVEDSPRVVEMWRSIGLPVLAVSDPGIPPPILRSLLAPCIDPSERH